MIAGAGADYEQSQAVGAGFGQPQALAGVGDESIPAPAPDLVEMRLSIIEVLDQICCTLVFGGERCQLPAGHSGREHRCRRFVWFVRDNPPDPGRFTERPQPARPPRPADDVTDTSAHGIATVSFPPYQPIGVNVISTTFPTRTKR